MRIPIWRNLRLSLFEPQNPDAVRVRIAQYYEQPGVLRVASWRGWMLLSVRYDWRNVGKPAPAATPGEPIPLTHQEAWEEVQRLSTELYRAEDRLGFVAEMCAIVDCAGGQITADRVQKWLEGPKHASVVIPERDADAAAGGAG